MSRPRQHSEPTQYGTQQINGYGPLDPLPVNGQSESVQNPGPISPLRRTFCLLMLFDLILSTILWILFTEMKADGPVMNEFKNQTVFYHFRTSLFDTVLLSLFRFLFLVLSYALLRSKKPWFVAIATAITCTVMLFKAIYYKYDKDKSGLEILDYMIIITPVVLSWVETWLMDLKVLPTESHPSAHLYAGIDGGISERSPLLNRLLHSRPAPPTESFYSPAPSESEAGDSSDDESKSFHSVATSHRRTQSSDLTQLQRYKEEIMEAQSLAVNILESDGWSKEGGSDEVNGIVYSKSVPKYGKVFKLVAEVNVDALTLFRDLVDNATSMPNWNPTVLEVRSLEQVSDDTDISYNIAAPGAGGMVSSRDFVYLRHWEQCDGWYITSSVSTNYPAMPDVRNYVRGEQGPSVIRMKDTGAKDKLRMEWLLNTNLKGWLPQYIIDQALSGVLMAYLENLRKHAASLINDA